LKLILKYFIYFAAFLKKISITIEFADKVDVSDVFESIGYKEIYFQNIDKKLYPYVWFLIPKEIKRARSSSGYKLQKSDRANFDCKLVLYSDDSSYGYFETGQNPITYIFGTKKDFHANRYLIYNVRPTIFINYYLFFWIIKFRLNIF